MFSPFSRLLATCLVLAIAPVSALHAEPAIIAKARSYLGTEAALTAVKSVHYKGTMTGSSATDASKPVSLAIDLVFQLPYQLRTARTTDSVVDTIGLDNYDGWHRVQDSKDPTRWRLQVLPTDQVKRQRAIVIENISFYRGLEKAGGKVIDLGSTTVNGVACRKIEFLHAADIIFFRYIDESTGRLLLSETETGSTIREEGEILVQGVRFPKVIINTSKTADGKEQNVTITFDSITLNESFPDSTFAIPSFSGK